MPFCSRLAQQLDEVDHEYQQPTDSRNVADDRHDEKLGDVARRVQVPLMGSPLRLPAGRAAARRSRP